MVVVRLAEDSIEEPEQVLLQGGDFELRRVDKPKKEVGDEWVHLGIHMEHAI